MCNLHVCCPTASPLSPVQSPVAEERFREELEMQVKDYPELPLFEKRVALFGAPPKPMPPDMAPRRPFVTDKVKPTFTKVCFRNKV